MKKLIFIFLCTILAVSISALKARAEYLFMIDGTILEAKINEETNSEIIIKTGKKTKKIPRENILRILYSKEYQAKKVISLTDGTSVTGYIVNEDSNSYLVRERLISPFERKILKAKIASITGYEYKDMMKKKRPINPAISVMGVFAMPLRYFSDRVDMGFGFLAGFTFYDFFVSGLDIGIQTGYLHFLPASDIVDYAQIIPISITFAYRFRVVRGFEISPRISGGYSYNVIYYDTDGNVRNGINFSREAKFEPLFTFGLDLSYAFTDLFSLGVGADYCIIIEKPEIMDFMAIHIDFAFRF